MRKYIYLAHDLACVCVALVLALYLRHGFPLIQEGAPEDIITLLFFTLVTGLVVFPLMNIHGGMWRFTASTELRGIIVAVGWVVLLSNSALFLLSRLDMVPRSVPPMHWALAAGMMATSRLMVRKLLGRAPMGNRNLKQHVLVVGASHTAELYLEFSKRIVQHHVVVEGFVDSNQALTDRLFRKVRILGTPLDLPQIVEQLRVHGIDIRQIILAQLIEDLTAEERAVLEELDAKADIDLVHFARDMAPHLKHQGRDYDDYYRHVQQLPAGSYARKTGFYPFVKRGFDVIFATVLLIVTLPLMALAGFVVALDIGLPLLFWQQRPGMQGKPFRLYKFRTMRFARRRADEDRRAHKSGDMARTSLIGQWLRRLRLDELPQLTHIIVGTMSFVGPRPLLPDDQPVGGEARLSVRPGVTGWAQIHGGDALSPEEKLVLDLWYIEHMSLMLDLRILARTLVVVLTPDRSRIESSQQAMIPKGRRRDDA